MAAIGNWQAVTENIWKLHQNDVTEKFNKLHNEEDKVQFIQKRKFIEEVPWLQFYLDSSVDLHAKSAEKSTQHRNQGNKLFQVKKYGESLTFYTQSVLAAPHNTEDLGLAYGNHSAANFYLGHYMECIEDIKLALDNQYPKSTSYKLYLRWTQCLYHLGDMEQATETLNVTKSSIKESESIEEKRKVKIMEEIKSLEKDLEKNEKNKVIDINHESVVPDLYQAKNTVLTQASSALKMCYTKEKGRFIQAIGRIPAGSPVIIEKPYASVLLPDHYLTHCHHCVGKLIRKIPCRRCTQVLYCSHTCREDSWSIYHETECQYLDICHSIGIAHLSLRIVLTAGFQYLQEFKEKMVTSDFYKDHKRVGGITENGTFDKSYLAVYDLMTHADDIDTADSFQYSMTAHLLLTILKLSGWLNKDKDSTSEPLTIDNGKKLSELDFTKDLYFGGLLLRHIEQLVCNAHAITELQVTETSDSSLVDGKSQERIATAIYPTTSLLNHSCDSSIIAGFDKDLLVVRVIKNIEDGEEIFNCYGPHHKRMSKTERQHALKTQYYFTCQCPPCTAVEEQDIFTSFCCPMCRKILQMNGDHCSCTSCQYSGESSVIVKQEEVCHKMFVSGLECLQKQDVKGAIQKFKDCLSAQTKILYKHNKYLAETQDCLARCYAISEQYELAIPHLRESVNTLCKLYGNTSIEYANELHKFAGVLYHAEEVPECLAVIDKSVNIFTLHFGDKYDLVQELEIMKLNILKQLELQ